MIGVILCGGESTRMGCDKGLIKTNYTTWTEVLMQQFAEFNVQIVLSLNKSQYETYSAAFHEIPIITDDLSLDINGPLRGLISVHLKFPSESLLAVACDMPSMSKQVLKSLINESLREYYEAFVFKNDGQIEPLCAIYTAQGLGKIYQLYKQGELRKHSLHYVLENMKTYYLIAPGEWKKYLKNYNSPSDLRGL